MYWICVSLGGTNVAANVSDDAAATVAARSRFAQMQMLLFMVSPTGFDGSAVLPKREVVFSRLEPFLPLRHGWPRWAGAGRRSSRMATYLSASPASPGLSRRRGEVEYIRGSIDPGAHDETFRTDALPKLVH